MDPEKVECEGCGKAINARFAACPLCGHQVRERAQVRPTSLDRQRPGGPPAPASDELIGGDMPKEARIALATAAMSGQPVEQPVTGPFSAVANALRPSDSTRGWLRVVELTLTVITIPFFLASALWLMVGVKRWGKVGIIDWVIGAFGGSSLLYMCLGTTFKLPGVSLFWSILIMLGAWAARGAIRFWSAHQRFLEGS